MTDSESSEDDIVIAAKVSVINIVYEVIIEITCMVKMRITVITRVFITMIKSKKKRGLIRRKASATAVYRYTALPKGLVITQRAQEPFSNLTSGLDIPGIKGVLGSVGVWDDMSAATLLAQLLPCSQCLGSHSCTPDRGKGGTNAQLACRTCVVCMYMYMYVHLYDTSMRISTCVCVCKI